MQEIIGYIDENQSHFLDQLSEFLSYKSVSADSQFKGEVRNCAQYLADHLSQIGLRSARVFPTKGHPIVYAEWLDAKDKPTLLFYGHYDVQPPQPLELWKSDPFKAEIRNGNIYARGVSDDKGQVFCHIKAIESLLKLKGELPVNIKLLIEGEEEVGSENLSEFVQDNRELLDADVLLVSDTPMYGENQPSICTSLRGLLYFELSVFGPKEDLHSGQKGGVVKNPIEALTNIVSQLKDNQHRVQIPGFYDGVPDLTPDQSAAIDRLGFNESQFKQELGVPDLVCESGYGPLACQWYRPTVELNGIWGGYTDEGAKTVIPSSAHAKLSMRLVGQQDPAAISQAFKSYIHAVAPKGVWVEINEFAGAYPATVDPNSPALRSAQTALEEVWGVPPVLIGEGGSIPIVAEIQKKLGIEPVLMGFNQPDDNIHAPNEKFGVINFVNGIKSAVHFYHQMGLTRS